MLLSFTKLNNTLIHLQCLYGLKPTQTPQELIYMCKVASNPSYEYIKNVLMNGSLTECQVVHCHTMKVLHSSTWIFLHYITTSLIYFYKLN
jgi:hypothetical protein